MKAYEDLKAYWDARFESGLESDQLTHYLEEFFKVVRTRNAKIDGIGGAAMTGIHIAGKTDDGNVVFHIVVEGNVIRVSSNLYEHVAEYEKHLYRVNYFDTKDDPDGPVVWDTEELDIVIGRYVNDLRHLGQV